MEVCVTTRVPESTPLFAASTLVDLTSTTAIGFRLVAVGSVITEASVMGAVLPADGTNSIEASLAVGVA